MKSLIVIFALIGISWYYVDLGADGILESVIAPFVFVLSLIWFTLWLVIVAGVKRRATISERFNVD
ncbi:MAG: hypothetical protein AAF417_16775 [Pseudomonadota bacterium]